MLTEGSDQIQIIGRLHNKLLSQVCCLQCPQEKMFGTPVLTSPFALLAAYLFSS